MVFFMRQNRKMMAVGAVLAAAVMMTACGGSTANSAAASSTASSTAASSVASSEPASSVVSSAEEQTGDVMPFENDSLEEMKSGSYKIAANITAIQDGQMTMTVYGYDAYDMTEIDALEVGDVIQTHDQGDDTLTKITVESIERDDDAGEVIINGGVEEGGLELWVDHYVYHTVTFNGYPVYYVIGEITLPMAEDVGLSDTSADPQADAVLADGIEEVTEVFNANPENWNCNNTTVFTDSGKVSSVLHVWVP